MRRVFILISLLSLGISLHAQAPAKEPPKPGRVEITVVDSTTKLGVKGAEVILARDTRPPYMGTSDSFGRIVFDEVEPSAYFVNSVKAKGYIFDIGDRVNLTALESKSVSATILMVPTGTIQGTITDESGQPIADAEVMALYYVFVQQKRLMPGPVGLTDAHGNYKLNEVQPGSYFIKASVFIPEKAKSGFPPVYYPKGETLSQALRVMVSPAANVERIDFQLREAPLFHVRGNVAGLTGQSTARSQLFLQNCTPQTNESMVLDLSSMGKVQTDGTFDIAGVLPGNYCALFREEDPKERGLLSFANETVTVVDRDVELRMAAVPPAMVSGTIKVEPGVSLPRSISLAPIRNNGITPLLSARINSDGTFLLNSVLPVEYSLDVPGTIKSVKLGGRDVNRKDFNPLALPGKLEIELGKATEARGRLTGKVDFGSAKPHSLQLTVASENFETVRTAFADEKGEFQVTALQPGNYYLFAWEKSPLGVANSPDFLKLLSGTGAKAEEGFPSSVNVRLITTREIDDAKLRY